MTNLERKIHQELTKRFKTNNWNPITLNMKTGGTVTVRPLADDDITTEDDVELWDVTTQLEEIPEPNSTIKYTLEGVCCYLADFENTKTTLLKTENNLKSFYEKNLKGHTAEELKLGNQIFEIIYQQSDDHNLSKLLKDETLLREACEQIHMGIHTGKNALKLSMDFETYSDWFKSVHAFRPRPFENGIAA